MNELPTPEAVRALIAKWRKTANCWPPFSEAGQSARRAYRDCADELEALIPTPAPHGEQE